MREALIDTLVYVSLGAGRHVDELRFSVLSAARFLTAERPEWQVRLYSDQPDTFADLPVTVEAVDETTARQWSGTHGYVYSAKILALADALQKPGTDRAAVIDGDTYFSRSPAELFSRLAPGKSLMHVREGRPAPPERAALEKVLNAHDPVDSSGTSWGMTAQEILWNSGVVGLCAEDAGLCTEVVALTDQLLEHGFGELSHTAEMVAFGTVLDRRTSVGECFDIVTHYWLTELRQPFDARLRDVWADAGMAPDDAFASLWRERPREGAVSRAKFRVKRLARRVGVEL